MRAALRKEARGCARRSTSAFWLARRGDLRARARRPQAPGRERHLQPRPLPVTRDRRPGQGYRGRRAADRPGHVQRLGRADALRAMARVQPDELPQRLGLAARQRDHRRRAQALRPRRRRADRRPRLFDVASQRATSACPSSTAASTAYDAARRRLPVACIPQAWAAAAPLLLVRTLLERFRPRGAQAGKVWCAPAMPERLPAAAGGGAAHRRRHGVGRDREGRLARERPARPG